MLWTMPVARVRMDWPSATAPEPMVSLLPCKIMAKAESLARLFTSCVTDSSVFQATSYLCLTESPTLYWLSVRWRERRSWKALAAAAGSSAKELNCRWVCTVSRALFMV